MKYFISILALLGLLAFTVFGGPTEFKQDGRGTEARGDYLFSEVVACTGGSFVVTNAIASYPWRPVLLKYNSTITGLVTVTHAHRWFDAETISLLETNLDGSIASTNIVTTNLRENTISSPIFTGAVAGAVGPIIADDYILPQDRLTFTYNDPGGTAYFLIHGKR